MINEVLHEEIPGLRHPHSSKRTEKGQGAHSDYTSERDTGHSAPSPPPPSTLTTDTQLLTDLYKVLGCRGPDSKLVNLASPLMVLPVGYLSTQEGYLPSNIDYLPSQDKPVEDPLEELQPQHISLSIFPSSSLHPLNFSCSEKLTLDQLKMGCDSIML